MARRFYRAEGLVLVAEQVGPLDGHPLLKTIQLGLDLPSDLTLEPGQTLDITMRFTLSPNLVPIPIQSVIRRHKPETVWESKPRTLEAQPNGGDLPGGTGERSEPSGQPTPGPRPAPPNNVGRGTRNRR